MTKLPSQAARTGAIQNIARLRLVIIGLSTRSSRYPLKMPPGLISRETTPPTMMMALSLFHLTDASAYSTQRDMPLSHQLKIPKLVANDLKSIIHLVLGHNPRTTK